MKDKLLMFFRATRLPNANGTEDKAALLTLTEACEFLRVSKWTVHRLIRSNQLETILIGRRRLVPRDAIDQFLTQLRQEAA